MLDAEIIHRLNIVNIAYPLGDFKCKSQMRSFAFMIRFSYELFCRDSVSHREYFRTYVVPIDSEVIYLWYPLKFNVRNNTIKVWKIVCPFILYMESNEIKVHIDLWNIFCDFRLLSEKLIFASLQAVMKVVYISYRYQLFLFFIITNARFVIYLSFLTK